MSNTLWPACFKEFLQGKGGNAFENECQAMVNSGALLCLCCLNSAMHARSACYRFREVCSISILFKHYARILSKQMLYSSFSQSYKLFSKPVEES